MFQLFKSILLVLVFFFVIGVASKAQNLVPNPSFEIYSQCPFDVNQVHFATGWTSYRETPEYFNSCNSGNFSVPCNARGCQNAATGNGYASLGNFSQGVNFREHIGIQLSSNLIIGQNYYLTIKISLSDYYGNSCATNKFGIRLSTIPFSYQSPSPIDNFAHIYSNTINADSTTWTIISGYFIADSSYSYICVGNFFDNQNIDTLNCSGANYIFNYYIDDVCVALDSLSCINFNGNSELVNEMFNVFPNPANDYINIECNSNLFLEIKIYDMLSKIMFLTSTSGTIRIDISKFAKGYYTLKIISDNRFHYYKILKL